ncbi:Sodium/hydrogen exchanger family-domain-containing protein [Bisporella sp. PMI_857]|nr:Sodium/hydrogen exchanger family-domain-containing protein [Bisporella sp. PMI_857]
MWDHLSINKPHLVYIILGGFTSLFMLCSSFIKEKMYIGEATVATICGVIFGPHAANLINPLTWGNTDQITLEFSRIVLVVQCFAVGVELPKYYMEKHWRSVTFLLIPVMTFGWLITSLFIWWMIPDLDWLQSLCVAACVTATDPVLASSVVGKGKFAKRVPKHLRDVLSAESGCNDGMAFPFIYLALYLIEYRPDANKVAFSWIVLTILYECVFGAFYGFMIGYIESFLVFYFVLALFCAGSGSILGVDDLLVGFAAGVGFSNDGWFTQKTEESHVSNVIDLLINLAYFVYLGTILPWEQYNSPEIGTTPWRLVVIAIFVLFFRRIPIMLMLKPFIPDIKTLARSTTGHTTPLASYPVDGAHNSELVALIWPITTFLVIASIIVHGSSIAVFTLGRHINTLTLTMSYTAAHEEGPGWLNRLPRITTTSRSQAKSFASESDGEGVLERADFPPGTLPPVGIPGHFLRRQRDDEGESRSSSIVPRRRKKKWDDGLGPGGPVSQSAIYPQRRTTHEAQRESTASDTLTPGDSPKNEEEEPDEKNERDLGEIQHDPEMEDIMHRGSSRDRSDHSPKAGRRLSEREVYQEGDDIIIENEDGRLLARRRHGQPKLKEHRRGPALAYQFGNTIIVEDEDGEVVKTYELPSKGKKDSAPGGEGHSNVRQTVMRMGSLAGFGVKPAPAQEAAGESSATGAAAGDRPVRQGMGSRMGSLANWGFGGKNTGFDEGQHAANEDDDRHIRFKIGGAGRRLTKEDFLKEIQSLDPKARCEIVEESDAPPELKALAKKDADDNSPGSSRLLSAKDLQVASGERVAKAVGAQMARNRGATVESPEDQREPSRPQPSRQNTGISSRKLSRVDSDPDDMEETATERRRREKALRGIDDVSQQESKRGRPRDRHEDDGGEVETAAEKRRREAALGVGKEDDSDDDDTPESRLQLQRQSRDRGSGSLRVLLEARDVGNRVGGGRSDPSLSWSGGMLWEKEE